MAAADWTCMAIMQSKYEGGNEYATSTGRQQMGWGGGEGAGEGKYRQSISGQVLYVRVC
jgi:hypothetical protein